MVDEFFLGKIVLKLICVCSGTTLNPYPLPKVICMGVGGRGGQRGPTSTLYLDVQIFGLKNLWSHFGIDKFGDFWYIILVTTLVQFDEFGTLFWWHFGWIFVKFDTLLWWQFWLSLMIFWFKVIKYISFSK